jgi:hypothetical protein
MLSQLITSNFGKSKSNLTGSLGVGYTILNTNGSITSARTTTGVYQITSGSGIYAAYASFPDNFHGSIVWDTGTTPPSYAIEQYNYEANNPNVDTISANIQFLIDMEGGRWKIDRSTNRMIFYKSDNITVVASFSLFDIDGNPTIDLVSERRRV